MEKKLVGLALALDHMKCNSMDSMDQRILIQKKIYLAQAFGINFGYSYHWYLRGPYSKKLTSDVLEVINLGRAGDLETEGFDLADNAKEKLDGVNALDNSKPANLSTSSWYELLASLMYLRDEYSVAGLKEKDITSAKLSEFKPWYSQKNIDEAWSTICE